MFKVIIGHSDDVDAKDAITEIIEECNSKIEDVKPNAGMLFSAIDYDYDVLLDEINKAYPGIELIGATTDGEISSEMGFMEDSVNLILFVSDTIEIKAVVGRNI